MRSSRMGGGSILRAASQVVSGKEAFSVGAGSSTARGGGADIRSVSVPSPLPPAAATSPTFAGGAVVWSDWETVNPEVEREEGEIGEESSEFWFLEMEPRSEEVEAAIWSLQQLVPFSILFHFLKLLWLFHDYFIRSDCVPSQSQQLDELFSYYMFCFN